jgi:adhesin/invasin
VSVDGTVAQVLSSSLRLGHVGVYDVSFRVPPGVANGEHQVRLDIAGVASNVVVLPGVDPAAPSIGAIVSAASFAANPAAPGSILSLFATSLEGEANTGLFPATQFDGLSVSFNGVAAPLFAVVPAAGQVNVLAPLELPETGEVEVRITSPKGASAAFLLPMASASPGMFRINDPSDLSQQFAAAMLGNTAWLAIPDDVAQSLSLPIHCDESGISPASYCGRPARPGEYVQLFLTGLGKVALDGNPNAAPLTTAQSLNRGDSHYQTGIVPEVTIGGVPAVVAFSGLTPGFAGLYQVNVVIPAAVTPGDRVPIRVSTPNGLSDTALIAIQAP